MMANQFRAHRGQHLDQVRLEIDPLGVAQKLEITADLAGRGVLTGAGDGGAAVAEVADDGPAGAGSRVPERVLERRWKVAAPSD